MTTLFLPLQRATALIASGPADDPDQKHLHILLTNPHGDNGEVLLVSVSSIREGRYHDPSCILQDCDHQFLRHPSFVHYGHLKITTAERLLNLAHKGIIEPYGALDVEVFARVIEGLRNSPHTAPKYIRFYDDSSASD